MAEKPVNVTPEDQKLQHANAQQNDLARVLAFLEETVKSRVDLNGFERQRIYIAAGETAHLSPPPFARSVVMVGLSSWTLTTMGTLSFSVTNPTAFIPILTPGAPVDVKNPTSADAQVTVVYLGENPSQLMASLFATTSTLTTQRTGTGTAQLTGSNPPLTAGAPFVAATIPYSDFVASANIYPYFPQVLHHNARERTFMIVNTMDEALTAGDISLMDSAVTGTGANPSVSWGNNVSLGAAGVSGGMIQTSEQASAGNGLGMLAAHIDSFQLTLGMGATLPTSGNVDIWVTELF